MDKDIDNDRFEECFDDNVPVDEECHIVLFTFPGHNSNSDHHKIALPWSLFGEGDTAITRVVCNVSLNVDVIIGSCLNCELRRSPTFATTFLRNISRYHNIDLDRSIVVVKVKPKWPCYLFRLHPDIAWSSRLLPLITMRLELETAMAWLSTLGGAHSALGEYHIKNSEEAGRLAVQQLKVAFRLGQPVLAAQCKVYLAMSLAQRRNFKHAMKIIRKQYSFAFTTEGMFDIRLIKMCQSVWHRVNHVYSAHGFQIQPLSVRGRHVYPDEHVTVGWRESIPGGTVSGIPSGNVT